MSYTRRSSKGRGGGWVRKSEIGGRTQSRSSRGRAVALARKGKPEATQIRRVQHHVNGSKDTRRTRQADEGATIAIDRRGVVTRMAENAVTITELEQLIGESRIDYCLAFQQPDGWFTVRAKLARERDLRYLVTFRQQGRPRRFSRLDVLFRLLHHTLGYNGVIQVLPYSQPGVTKRPAAH